MPCINSSFELLYEQMEPSRSLTTSSQGLSATTEVRAPFRIYLRFKDFVFNHVHGRVNFQPFLPKNSRECFTVRAKRMPSAREHCKKKFGGFWLVDGSGVSLWSQFLLAIALCLSIRMKNAAVESGKIWGNMGAP
jgi:hypothetical protein